MKLTKAKTAILITVVIISILFIGLKYFQLKNYYGSNFPSNTEINGVDCSGLTVSEANRKLSELYNSKKFTVNLPNGGSFTFTNLNLVFSIDDQLKEIMDTNHTFPVSSIFFNRKNLKIPMISKGISRSIEMQLKKCDFLVNPKATPTKNAYIDMTTREFPIVPEVYGTNIDKKAFARTMLNDISKNRWSLDFHKDNFYKKPTVTADSTSLQERRNYCIRYLSQKITYKFGLSQYTISPALLNRMKKVDDTGQVTVNKKAVSSFINRLSSKYNTTWQPLTFNSTTRGSIRIAGGTYGFAINHALEKKRLIKNIKSGADITREPVYSQRGYSYGGDGVGSTYVEIDIGEQHLWYYQNGRLLVDAPIVTGCISTDTPTVRGVFTLQYKAENVPLRGTNADGTRYNTMVNYWMPFYADYGMHDATWRPAFGGSIYINSGSHGCVNMPLSKAGALYSHASAGCPVVIY